MTGRIMHRMRFPSHEEIRAMLDRHRFLRSLAYCQGLARANRVRSKLAQRAQRQL